MLPRPCLQLLPPCLQLLQQHLRQQHCRLQHPLHPPQRATAVHPNRRQRAATLWRRT